MKKVTIEIEKIDIKIGSYIESLRFDIIDIKHDVILKLL
jgi:hypothetical protein